MEERPRSVAERNAMADIDHILLRYLHYSYGGDLSFDQWKLNVITGCLRLENYQVTQWLDEAAPGEEYRQP